MNSGRRCAEPNFIRMKQQRRKQSDRMRLLHNMMVTNMEKRQRLTAQSKGMGVDNFPAVRIKQEGKVNKSKKPKSSLSAKRFKEHIRNKRLIGIRKPNRMISVGHRRFIIKIQTFKKLCTDRLKESRKLKQTMDEVRAEALRTNIALYNLSRQSIRSDDLFWPYDLEWSHSMPFFVHPCLLLHYSHALGLMEMLFAMNSGHCQFDIFTSLPSVEEYPAMAHSNWKEYNPKSERNPYPICCKATDPPQCTLNEFISANTLGNDNAPMDVDAQSSTYVAFDSLLIDYAFRGNGASNLSTLCLVQYLMQYETISEMVWSNLIPFDPMHPWNGMGFMQKLRAVPLPINEAYNIIISILGPVPQFPSVVSIVTASWVDIAGIFGRYYMRAFHPSSLHACLQTSDDGDINDSWGGLVHFLRFLSNSQSELQSIRGKALLAKPPACCDTMKQTLNLIRQFMQLSGVQLSSTLDPLLHQAQWSRTILVDSFAHLPIILQREVTKRLHDKHKAFSTFAHSLDQLYGIRAEMNHLLDSNDPMDPNSILDNTFQQDQDNLIVAGAVFLQFTAISNHEIESRIFIVQSKDKNTNWYAILVLYYSFAHLPQT